ncbi:hypothetical protein [uncultured Prevotella sp.]|nr:hypothetical protein [uncultured Prevotella sp.]
MSEIAKKVSESFPTITDSSLSFAIIVSVFLSFLHSDKSKKTPAEMK